MVTPENGEGVILLGCYEKRTEINKIGRSIYKLHQNKGLLKWKKMIQELKYPRYSTNVMFIPDDLVTCVTMNSVMPLIWNITCYAFLLLFGGFLASITTYIFFRGSSIIYNNY